MPDGGLAERNVDGEVVLAKGADEGRYDPGPFSAEFIDEEGEEDDGAGCFDEAVDSCPEGYVGEADGGEDCGGVVVYCCGAGPC